MPCKYNPASPTEKIPEPKLWCNIRWGYCQWVIESDENIKYCPLAAYDSWFESWITSQTDKNKTVLVKIGSSEPTKMTVEELQKAYAEGLQVSGLTIDDGTPGPDPHDVTRLVSAAMKDGNLTIYDDSKLISLGRKAFYGDDTKITMTRISLPYCLYIGREAFFGCENLQTVDFSEKEDDRIPILDDINAFYNINGTVLKNLEIIVPERLYQTWIQSPNWASLKKYIIRK